MLISKKLVIPHLGIEDHHGCFFFSYGTHALKLAAMTGESFEMICQPTSLICVCSIPCPSNQPEVDCPGGGLGWHCDEVQAEPEATWTCIPDQD